jgi:DNA-binding MarR family transcriptional regulator
MADGYEFGRRDRAVALASLGAAALGRLVFTREGPGDPQPLEMQVLVALALQDSLDADPPDRTGTYWLSLALRVEDNVVDQVVRRLEQAGLVARSAAPHVLHLIEWELDEDDEDVLASELPISLTWRGVETVERWLARTRALFGAWPYEPAGVDDAVG